MRSWIGGNDYAAFFETEPLQGLLQRAVGDNLLRTLADPSLFRCHAVSHVNGHFVVSCGPNAQFNDVDEEFLFVGRERDDAVGVMRVRNRVPQWYVHPSDPNLPLFRDPMILALLHDICRRHTGTDCSF